MIFGARNWPQRDGLVARTELPTWLLVVTVYGGWLLITMAYHSLPWPITLVAGSWIIAWHMSLQHEIIHGHPTRSRAINAALGFLPLGLWLPYMRYRETHLAHHREEILTDPVDDPESYYVSAETWARFGAIRRALALFNNTLAGRLLIGPALGIWGFLAVEARACGSAQRFRLWAVHLMGVTAVLYWVLVQVGIPLWAYLALFVYPGYSLSLLRSFAEHRAATLPERRTAIVESTSVLGLLFLHNNLHAVHHIRPDIPWYDIPDHYTANRDALVARNGGLVYNGYRDIFRRFLLRMHDQPVHSTASAAQYPPAVVSLGSKVALSLARDVAARYPTGSS